MRCRMERSLYSHFPKIAPPSLPNRRVHSRFGLLRRIVSQPLRLLPVPTVWFHATSPVYSSSILSALLQRLTTLGFIVVSPTALSICRIPAMPVLPFEAFPPPIAVVAELTLAGEAFTSSPTVTLLCCLARAWP